jgi:aryl-alcohol dehydrogenase-like predicted oxidoreductase
MTNPVSKIGLGTVQFGIPYGISNKLGQTPEAEVISILKYAKETGIDVLDTATAYGASEKVLGKNNLNGFKIISKFILQENGKNLSEQLDTTLKSLNISSIYGYLAHRPMDIVNNPKNWDALNDFKKKGIIKKTGFSFNEVNEIEMILSKNIIPNIIQVPYNYIDNRFEVYMKDLKTEGCEINTRSTFLQGLFFVDIKKLNPFFDEVKPLIQSLQEHYSNLPSVLLKYCTEKPFIDKVIIGVNTLEQLKKNIAGINKAETLKTINFEISETIKIPSKWPK